MKIIPRAIILALLIIVPYTGSALEPGLYAISTVKAGSNEKGLPYRGLVLQIRPNRPPLLSIASKGTIVVQTLKVLEADEDDGFTLSASFTETIDGKAKPWALSLGFNQFSIATFDNWGSGAFASSDVTHYILASIGKTEDTEQVEEADAGNAPE